MFKIGDKVKCVDAQHGQWIEVGRIYIVEKTWPANGGIPYVTLKDLEGLHSYNSNRFVLADNQLFNELVDNYYETFTIHH